MDDEVDEQFFEPRWDKVMGGTDPVTGKIVMQGRRAEFQNGFGAWKRVTYNCFYDAKNARVDEADVF